MCRHPYRTRAPRRDILRKVQCRRRVRARRSSSCRRPDRPRLVLRVLRRRSLLKGQVSTWRSIQEAICLNLRLYFSSYKGGGAPLSMCSSNKFRCLLRSVVVPLAGFCAIDKSATAVLVWIFRYTPCKSCSHACAEATRTGKKGQADKQTKVRSVPLLRRGAHRLSGKRRTLGLGMMSACLRNGQVYEVTLSYLRLGLSRLLATLHYLSVCLQRYQ